LFEANLGDGFGLVGGLVQRLGDFLNVCHGDVILQR
jgi:hypothetical protein